MTGITLGSTPITGIYLGSTPITGVYLGSTKLWPPAPVTMTTTPTVSVSDTTARISFRASGPSA